MGKIEQDEYITYFKSIGLPPNKWPILLCNSKASEGMTMDFSMDPKDQPLPFVTEEERVELLAEIVRVRAGIEKIQKRVQDPNLERAQSLLLLLYLMLPTV